MISVQELLDKKYPNKSKLTQLNLDTLVLRQQGLLKSNESLEGSLKVEGFNNLKCFLLFLAISLG